MNLQKKVHTNKSHFRRLETHRFHIFLYKGSKCLQRYSKSLHIKHFHCCSFSICFFSNFLKVFLGFKTSRFKSGSKSDQHNSEIEICLCVLQSLFKNHYSYEKFSIKIIRILKNGFKKPLAPM